MTDASERANAARGEFPKIPMFVAREIRRDAYVRTDFIEAGDATQMETLFAQKMSELVTENVERRAAGKPELGVAEVELASIGDWFLVALLVIGGAPTVWEPGKLARVRGVFWMSANAEGLADYQEAALASLRNGHTLSNIASGVAGGKTRFMAFMAAEQVTEERHES